MNLDLIRDEGHRNPSSLPELRARMSDWLADEYQAYLIERGARPIGYALFRSEPDHIYLRHFFIRPSHRRQGFGRGTFEQLVQHVWPPGARLRLDVLVNNEVGIRFWRSVGFQDYCIVMERDASE
jgi:GNAT superfamily N-acetyltransferase